MFLSPRNPFLSVCAALTFAAPLANVSAAQATYRWQNVAIGGGGFVSGVVFHPRQPGLVYLRTDVGGAYRRSGDEASWVPLNDDLGPADSELQGILSLALDPTDARRVYLACGQYLPEWGRTGAILRSEDQGQTWVRTEVPFHLGGNADGRSSGERLQVNPFHPDQLLLGTNNDGLWESHDFGKTWTPLPKSPGKHFTVIWFSPATDGLVYAGVKDEGLQGLWKSTDNGNHWTREETNTGDLVPYSLSGDTLGHAYLTLSDGPGPNGITRGAVLHLDPARGAWVPLKPPPGMGGYSGVSVAVKDPATVVISTLDRWEGSDQLFLSHDRGTTWKAVLKNATWEHSSAPWTSDMHIHWTGTAVIDPFRSDHLVFTTGYGLYEGRSVKAEGSVNVASWNLACTGLEETVPLGIALPPGDRAPVSVIGDFDGFRHEDLDHAPGAKRLRPFVGTTRQIDFAAKAPDVMARLGEACVQLSTDAGKNWNYVPAPFDGLPGRGALGVSADGERLLWISGKGRVFALERSGAYWRPAQSLGDGSLGAVALATSREETKLAYAYVASTGSLWRTETQGDHFTRIQEGLGKTVTQLKCRAGRQDEVWLGDAKRGLYRSNDRGKTFARVAETCTAFGFGGPVGDGAAPALYVIGKVKNLEGILRSDDDGINWRRIDDDQHRFGGAQFIEGDPNHPGRVFIGTSGRGLLYGDPLP